MEGTPRLPSFPGAFGFLPRSPQIHATARLGSKEGVEKTFPACAATSRRSAQGGASLFQKSTPFELLWVAFERETREAAHSEASPILRPTKNMYGVNPSGKPPKPGLICGPEKMACQYREMGPRTKTCGFPGHFILTHTHMSPWDPPNMASSRVF